MKNLIRTLIAVIIIMAIGALVSSCCQPPCPAYKKANAKRGMFNPIMPDSRYYVRGK